MNKHSLPSLIKKIRRVPDEAALTALFLDLGPQKITKPVRVAFVNAHAVNLGQRHPDFLGYLFESNYILRDGSGMKILFKMLGRDPGLNMNGTDLIPRLMEAYKGKDAALLGTQEPYLGQAAALVAQKGVNPVLSMDGFRQDREYVEALREHRPFLIILGMGMPKQERIAALLARELDYPCVIICGGAILDFMAGRFPRAPLVFRKTGMEWLYRLGKEPRRLFARYVLGNFLFLLHSAQLALHQKISMSRQKP
jgi:exopolysaccharide biosynthesis WecB/TagA/CpsF family protein